MNISQEPMDISQDLDQPDEFPRHQQNIRTANGYYDYTPERRMDVNRRRHVKIRNPHYITPGPPISRPYAHHHYPPGNHYGPSPQGLAMEHTGQDISATPRRGPWRYLPVLPRNPTVSNHNIVPPPETSEDTLSDEFEESEVDMGKSSNYRQPMPTFINRPRDVVQQPNTNQLAVPHYLSPRKAINQSPSRMIIQSPNALNKSFVQDRSPRGPSSRQYSQNQMRTPDSSFRRTQNIQPTDCNALEDEYYRTASNDDHTDRNSPADFSSISLNVHSKHVKSKSPREPASMRNSPRFKQISKQTSHPPKASPSRIQEHIDADNWLSTSVTPFTPTSIRRNSTPFLNRPKATNLDGKTIVRALQTPANELSPVMNQPNSPKQVNDASPESEACDMPIAQAKSILMTTSSGKYFGINQAKKPPRERKRDSGEEETDTISDYHSAENLQRIVPLNSTTVSEQRTNQDSYHIQRPPEADSAKSGVSAVSLKKPRRYNELEALKNSNSFFGTFLDESQSFSIDGTTRHTRRSDSVASTSSNVFIDSDGGHKARGRYIKNMRKSSDTSLKNTSDNKGERDNGVSMNSKKIPSTKRSMQPDANIFKVPVAPVVVRKANTKSKGSAALQPHSTTSSPITVKGTLSEEQLNEAYLYIKNWTPRIKGKKLLFEGDLLDFG